MTDEPTTPVRRISLTPPKEPAFRSAGRLISMVHELHKAGYQRIRICPGMAPNGIHWRCVITVADNTADNGYSILHHMPDDLVARYTSGQGDDYFGWTDVKGLSARELAVRFIQRFPKLVEAGQGRDWAYAGWLTDVLGRVEQGGSGDFPVFYADYPLDNDWLREWSPPPPIR
jgi:hypothetical protein